MASSPLLAEAVAVPFRVAASTARNESRESRARRGDDILLAAVPSRLDNNNLPANVRQVIHPGDHPEVIVLTERHAGALISARLPPTLAAIVPVIDASGRGEGGAVANRSRADVRIDFVNRFSLSEAIDALRPAIESLRALPSQILDSTDPRLALLARVAVRQRAMEPRRDPSMRETITYADALAIPGAVASAEELVSLKVFERRFFDSLMICPRCESARLCLRERCGSCRSSNLVEQAILHHLRCAAQAPEQDFRQGTDLVCPKCRMHLEHFSIDYDRPGNILLCQDCGHTSSDCSVGYVCLDCEADGESSDLDSRTVWSYRPTEIGLDYLRSGAPLPKTAHDVLADRVAAFASREHAAKRPFCVLTALLRRPSGSDCNSRSWNQTCSLFGTLFRETFTPGTEIVDLSPQFVAMLAGHSRGEVVRALPEIRADLERHLRVVPDAAWEVLTPRDIEQMLQRSA